MAQAIDQTPDSHLAATLTALRGLTFDGFVADTQHLVPGVFFSLDPEGKTAVHVDSLPGNLLAMRVEVERPGRWLSLNMGVGDANLAGCRIVSFACKSDARTGTQFRVCLRSGVAGGYRDAFFPKTVICGAGTSIHMDVLDLTKHDVPIDAPWREIVIFFEPYSMALTLQDFRLTIL
jgi:hypothetical protein